MDTKFLFYLFLVSVTLGWLFKGALFVGLEGSSGGASSPDWLIEVRAVGGQAKDFVMGYFE